MIPYPRHPPILRSRLSTLTRSQFHVLRKLREGKLNKQIAYELGIGETTVKAHMTQVLRKLAFVNRTEGGRVERGPCGVAKINASQVPCDAGRSFG